VSEFNLNLETKYWSDLLGSYTNVAKIPYDYFNKESDEKLLFKSLILEESIYKKLIDFSSRNGISIEIIIETIYGLILQKYTYEEDVVFGKTLDFVPLRIYYKNNCSFMELLKKVQHQWIRSLEYANNPFIYIENESLLKDKLINTALFYKEMDIQDCIERFDKLYEFFVVLSARDCLEIQIGYNNAVYKSETVNRVLGEFRDIIEQILTDENILVDDIEFISKSEKDVVLHNFNNTQRGIPIDRDYISLFRECVDKYPENIAVRDEYKCINYRELDKLTDKLGGYLNHIGIHAEDIVAVMLPRNLNIVVAAISIMKAGGIFFPIDINNPKERIEYLLEDSNAKVVITSDELKYKVKTIDTTIVDIDSNCYLDRIYKLTETITPDNGVYTISTSGSTGRPKTMTIEHKSLINMCFHSIESIEITEEDICGVYLSFSFDAVMKQIFPYLLVGASVDIMPEESKFNEYTVNEYCEEEDITILALPTAIAKLFIKNCNNFSIRVLQTGGERLKGYKHRDYKLYNEYGPAEFTVISTSFLVDREYDRVPIGKPIYNTYAYVLDKTEKVCPIGVPGELCLSGVQISRGYLRDEELTKKSFVPNPFRKDEYTEKMYRTGDLVRWLEDGSLDYIGRLDNQVKIGEFRIDLYEIENTINRIKEIKSSVCVSREDEEGEMYLIAYYVVDDHDYDDVNSRYIRYYLERQLPSYMIPKIIVRIDKIPVTPIGKVNKRALPM
jgi:amino acid adenylation domain-containing protein